ncbi:hypothetical protein [Vibrio coralliirubri]|uniref:hypothetical protein n=1 Tax=Vibrio coralliirubri TaxID=1516159 RepID=UPI000A3A8ACB|nr:hypothetical protein [Vibrio coralliirubri]
MAVRKSATPVSYNNNLNGSTYNSKEYSPNKEENKKTIKPMSYKKDSKQPKHRKSNADSVAEQFLASTE